MKKEKETKPAKPEMPTVPPPPAHEYTQPDVKKVVNGREAVTALFEGYKIQDVETKKIYQVINKNLCVQLEPNVFAVSTENIFAWKSRAFYLDSSSLA